MLSRGDDIDGYANANIGIWTFSPDDDFPVPCFYETWYAGLGGQLNALNVHLL